MATARRAETRERAGAAPPGLALALAATSTASARATAASSCEEAWPWSRLDRSARAFVRPVPLVLTAGAIAAPFALSPPGADHWIRVRVQSDLGGRYDLEHVTLYAPVAWLGSALVSYTTMRAVDAPCRQQRTAAAMTQAIATSFGVVTGLKFVVGRGWPNGGLDPRAPDRLSHPELATQYSPFQGEGIAWPSGHTGVSFAAAAALRASLPEDGWARWLGYPLAIGVGLGMIWGDHHWASDVVSGALLGEAIGSSVGAAFHEDHSPRRAGWVLVPMGGELRGVAVAGSF
jgi:membrane-associated phospholipid phosphatase